VRSRPSMLPYAVSAIDGNNGSGSWMRRIIL
jgi:hypothetical protein